ARRRGRVRRRRGRQRRDDRLRDRRRRLGGGPGLPVAGREVGGQRRAVGLHVAGGRGPRGRPGRRLGVSRERPPGLHPLRTVAVAGLRHLLHEPFHHLGQAGRDGRALLAHRRRLLVLVRHHLLDRRPVRERVLPRQEEIQDTAEAVLVAQRRQVARV